MAAKTPITLIMTDIVNALSNVFDKKHIFLGRPDSTKNNGCPLTKFAVVELPVKIEDYVIGNKKWMLDTSGVIYLMVKTKENNTMNLNSTSDIVESVESLFPIRGEVCKLTNPAVLMSGADEYGYFVTSISFDLRTKVNAFKSN